jgi:hypothetical protein
MIAAPITPTSTATLSMRDQRFISVLRKQTRHFILSILEIHQKANKTAWILGFYHYWTFRSFSLFRSAWQQLATRRGFYLATLAWISPAENGLELVQSAMLEPPALLKANRAKVIRIDGEKHILKVCAKCSAESYLAEKETRCQNCRKGKSK